MAVVVDLFHLAAYVAQTQEYLNPHHLSHFIHLRERLAFAFAASVRSTSTGPSSVSPSSIASAPGTMPAWDNATTNTTPTSGLSLRTSGLSPPSGPGTVGSAPPAKPTADPFPPFPRNTSVSPTVRNSASRNNVRTPPPTMIRQPSTPLRTAVPVTAKDIHPRPTDTFASVAQVKESAKFVGLPALPRAIGSSLERIRQAPMTPTSIRSSPANEYLPLLAFPPLLGNGNGDAVPDPGPSTQTAMFGRSFTTPNEPQPLGQMVPAFLPATTASTGSPLMISEEDAAELLKLFPEFGNMPITDGTPASSGIMTRTPQGSAWTADLLPGANPQYLPAPAPPTTPRNATDLPFPVLLGNDDNIHGIHRYRNRVNETPPSPSPMRGQTGALLHSMLVRPFIPRKRSSKTTAPHARPSKHSKIAGPRIET
ncbi:hypothetical protein CF326_g6997 [Tilletia indica]|nr:hypothetical protein CF326_g6997 [Tilletia indica]